MHLFNHIAAMTVLAGPLSLVLGAQNVEEITINMQLLQQAITNAENYAKNINAINGLADYGTLVNNNNGLRDQVKDYNDALEGTTTLPNDQQIQVIQESTPLTHDVAAYYQTIDDKVKDFLLQTQRKAVEESVDGLEEALDAYFKSLEALGPMVAAAVEGQASNDDEARETLDEDYDDDTFIV